MLVNDRVTCDLCGDAIGQLFNQAALQADMLSDLRLPPHFTACPDCLDAACSDSSENVSL